MAFTKSTLAQLNSRVNISKQGTAVLKTIARAILALLGIKRKIEPKGASKRTIIRSLIALLPQVVESIPFHDAVLKYLA